MKIKDPKGPPNNLLKTLFVLLYLLVTLIPSY